MKTQEQLRKAEFLKRLAILAEICRHTLDDFQTQMYDTELKNRGYGNLAKAIDRLLVTRKSSSPFPSVAELKNLVPLNVVENLPRGTCGACNDGYVFAVPKMSSNVSPYVFKCQCEVGQGRPENYPTWTGDLAWRVAQ